MPNESIEKIQTHIPGFEHISCGGLPAARTTLVCGSAGSGKTVLGAQFLAEGINKASETGVFVTFEESAEAIRKNMAGFGWDITMWEAVSKWAFVDVSPKVFEMAVEAGEYDLYGLLAWIKTTVSRIGAKRVVLDSVGAIFSHLTDSAAVRRGLFTLASTMNALGVTTVITTEREDEYGGVGRYGVEEFVADNVILLRNPLEEERRRRTIEILKFRGTSHLKGEFPFTIISDGGMEVIPLSALRLKQRSSARRIGSGNKGLDEMCGGGFFQNSVVLVSGPTGTGKTLLATEYMKGAAVDGQRAIFFGYEESQDQLYRNALGWGVDFDDLVKQGKLKLICEYPESRSLDDHLLVLRREVNEFKPTRIVLDSVSALERIASGRNFREFAVGLTAFIKELEISALITATTPTLLGGTSVTEAHISTITDSIILLRYVEIFGEMRRGVTVLKMRGSSHDKNIREFNITGHGMQIGKPFRGVSGILSGVTAHGSASEIDYLGQMFKTAK